MRIVEIGENLERIEDSLEGVGPGAMVHPAIAVQGLCDDLSYALAYIERLWEEAEEK